MLGQISPLHSGLGEPVNGVNEVAVSLQRWPTTTISPLRQKNFNHSPLRICQLVASHGQRRSKLDRRSKDFFRDSP